MVKDGGKDTEGRRELNLHRDVHLSSNSARIFLILSATASLCLPVAIIVHLSLETDTREALPSMSIVT